MFKMIFVFLVLSILVAMGIQVFRNMTGMEKWKLTKIGAFAIMSSAIAIGILSVVVVLF